MQDTRVVPPTISVEQALNSRVSSGLEGQHHGRAVVGETLDSELISWLGWAAHQVHGLGAEIPLRTYILTPTKNYLYDPAHQELKAFGEAFSEVFSPGRWRRGRPADPGRSEHAGQW
jgi:hypothetical protein